MKDKIAIACGCRKLNYGSILQSYALCEVIKKMNYDCEFVWVSGNLFKHYNIRWQKICGVFVNVLKTPSLFPKVVRSCFSVYKSKQQFSQNAIDKFNDFKANRFNIKLYSYNELKKRQKEYKCCVCGSDQIWNTYELYMDPMYFLQFAEPSKRVAYAPSMGTDSISSYNKKVVKKYLSHFKAISVREKSSVGLLKDLIKRDVPVVLDPTLLLTAHQWEESLKLDLDDNMCASPYCLVYFLNEPSQNALKMIEETREKFKIKAIPYKYACYKDDECVDAGPTEFVKLIKNADYIITDSFHGTIFSINFNKKFLVFERQYNAANSQSTRLKSILEQLDLLDRYDGEFKSELKCQDVLSKGIDYNTVNSKLMELRKESLMWLSDAIDTESAEY